MGDSDFNYYEMMELDRQMAAVHLPHRIEIWDGPPRLAARALAGQAIAWMEIPAMRSGTRPKDSGDRRASVDGGPREGALAGGRQALWDAHHTWEAMADGYAGLRDVSEARKRAEEIAAGGAFKKEAKERQERIAADTKLLAEGPVILGQVNPGNPVTVAQIVAQLRVPQLKKREQSSDPEEKLSAQRILNTLVAQTSFYIPQMLLAERSTTGRSSCSPWPPRSGRSRRGSGCRSPRCRRARGSRGTRRRWRL